MTREEAKDLFRKDRDSYGKVKQPMTKVDKIYDELGSRTCEKCNYFIKQRVSCFIMPIDIQTLPKGFSCNKFEIKLG